MTRYELVNLHVEDRTHMDPDWVLVGAPYDRGGTRGVMVLASRSLDHATLHGRMDVAAMTMFQLTTRVDPVRVQTTLTAELTDYVVAIGPTYEAALVALLANWTPDDPTRPVAFPDGG